MGVPAAPSSFDPGPDEASAFLAGTLDALRDFVGAAAGWLGLRGADGRLHFPARSGGVPDAWCTFQQGQSSVWGFAVSEGPTLLNDLPPLPLLGQPGLHNLLSCSLAGTAGPLGHLVLANKEHGFTSHDATAVQAVAHLLSKYLSTRDAGPSAALSRAVACLALDRSREGIFIVDQEERLLFANDTWLRWTGFAAEEICGQRPPYPFWISHRELATLGSLALQDPAQRLWSDPPAAGQATQRYLPFRHRNHTLFWCQVDSVVEECEGRPLRIAFLRRLPSSPLGTEGVEGAPAFQRLAENLPCPAALVDPQGRLLWVNDPFFRELAATPAVLGQKLQSQFTPTSAAALEKVLRGLDSAELGSRGRLTLQRQQDRAPEGGFIAYWQAVPLPQGTCLFLAFAEDWEAIWLPASSSRPAGPPGPPQTEALPLLLRPGAEIGFWDERWQRLTGLDERDLQGIPSEVVLDWLFPHQRDREAVADLLHDPRRLGGQLVLQVAGSNGGRALHCSFFPVRSAAGRDGDPILPPADSGTPGVPEPGTDAWLLLAYEPAQTFREPAASGPFFRQFARGLSILLEHYFSVPVGLAETALDRNDLPPELASAFGSILETCVRVGRLVGVLQDLAADSPGPLQPVALAAVVAAFVEEFRTETDSSCEWAVAIHDEDALVRVNPRMIKGVLRQFLANAVDAVLTQDRRRIRIAVHATDAEVFCEINDTGPGLPVEDWTTLLMPFHSTKGPFARQGDQAALDALGLGLTVSRHLLALHGGRLEMHARPGEGTVVTFALPRCRLTSADEAVAFLRSPAQSAFPTSFDQAAETPP
jgi:PAS domain-containing protein